MNVNLFERIDIRENKWSDYKINNNKYFDDLFGTIIVDNNMHSRLLFASQSY